MPEEIRNRQGCLRKLETGVPEEIRNGVPEEIRNRVAWSKLGTGVPAEI